MHNQDNLIPVKPGEIRNKKGKPKGTKNWSTIYKRFLKIKLSPKDYNIPFVEGDHPLSLQEMIALKHLNKALEKPEARDIELIMDRVDGKQVETKVIKSANIYEGLTEEELKEEDKRLDEIINNE